MRLHQSVQVASVKAHIEVSLDTVTVYEISWTVINGWSGQFARVIFVGSFHCDGDEHVSVCNVWWCYQTWMCTARVDLCIALATRQKTNVIRNYAKNITSTCRSRTATVETTSPRSYSGTHCCKWTNDHLAGQRPATSKLQ